ncbi:MAG: redoxin domain-containing protein [Thermomicrobiales bacterium]
MDLLLLVIRIGLAGVLLTASIGKLIDLRNPAGREAMEAFGIPASLAPAAAIALPILELVLGLLLLPVGTAWWAGLGTLLLMLVFMGGIARQMQQGNSPDCHCFGQLHSAPAGPRALARNAVFAAAAAILVLFGWNDPGVSIGGWFGDRTGVELTLLVVSLVAIAAIALLGWTVLQLMSQAGRLLSRIETLEGAMGIDPETAPTTSTAEHSASPSQQGAEPANLAVGSVAPDFTLPDLAGQPVSLASLRAGGLPLLLIFTSPSCTPCTRLMPDIARWQREGGQRLRTVVVARGEPAVNAAKANDAGVTGVLLQPEREISLAFGATSTPSAVIVMPDGRIGSALARGATAVRALADAQLAGTAAPIPAAPAVVPPTAQASPSAVMSAPALSLPPLDGDATTPPVTLATLGLGTRPIVLFFTDPRCDPCEALLPDLVAWQREAGDRARMAVISRGEPEANRRQATAHGLDGVAIPILMQQDMEAIAAYGVLQAPAAVLITREVTWDGAPAYGEAGVRTLLSRALAPEGHGAGTARANGHAGAVPTQPAPEIGVGDPVPAIALPDLAGERVQLVDPEGAPVDRVLLFWRANCGYCQRMLPQLHEWEATRSADSPELVVISTSQPDEMIAQGFASRVVLDHGVNVGRRFGSRGTPSAVRVGADGRVTAPIASGAQAVMQVITQERVADSSATPAASHG